MISAEEDSREVFSAGEDSGNQEKTTAKKSSTEEYSGKDIEEDSGEIISAEEDNRKVDRLPDGRGWD